MAKEKISSRPSKEVLPSYVELFGPHSTENLLAKEEKTVASEQLIEDLESCPIHFVCTTDTLSGIAIKYNVKVEDIRKANRLFNDCIISRQFLYIPNTNLPSLSTRSEEDEKKSLVKRFQIKTKCINVNEARHYMEQSNWCVNTAIKQYWNEVGWELVHPPPELPLDTTTTQHSLFDKSHKAPKHRRHHPHQPHHPHHQHPHRVKPKGLKSIISFLKPRSK